MFRFWKNPQKGSALVFVFMLIILFAAFSASMFQISITTRNLSGAVVESNDADYYAELGAGYFIKTINNWIMDDEGIDRATIITRLTNNTDVVDDPNNNVDTEYEKQKPFANNTGWFQLMKAENSDPNVLLTVRAFVPSGTAKAGPLDHFVEKAYAQTSGMEMSYQILVGPQVKELVEGGGIYARTMKINTLHLFPIDGTYGVPSAGEEYNGFVVSSDTLPAGYPSTTKPDSGRKDDVRIEVSNSDPDLAGLKAYTNEVLTKAKATFNYYYNDASETELDDGDVQNGGVWAGSIELGDHSDVDNNTLVLGDGSTSTMTFVEGEQLHLDGHLLLVGPMMIKLETNLKLRGNGSKIVMDVTKGPVIMIMEGEFKIEGSKTGIVVYHDRSLTGALDYSNGAAGSSGNNGFTVGYENRIGWKDPGSKSGVAPDLFFGTGKDGGGNTTFDFANGRKLGMILFDGKQGAKITSSDNNAKIGCLMVGANTGGYGSTATVATSVSALNADTVTTFGSEWRFGSGGSTSPTSQINPMLNLPGTAPPSDDSVDASDDDPTTEHFWIVAGPYTSGTPDRWDIAGNNEPWLTGVMVTPDREVKWTGNKVSIYGLLALDSVDNSGNSSDLYIDARIQAFPAEEKLGTFHIKMMRRAE